MFKPQLRLTPEMVHASIRHIIDFSRQERYRVGQRRALRLHIGGICQECQEGWWIEYGYAQRKKTPWCARCHQSRHFGGHPSAQGWFIHPAGYKIVNVRQLYPEWSDDIHAHLTGSHGPQRARWFAEHRVVALLPYGPEIIRPGTMVRHLDGNKRNNAPDNLLPGSAKDNVHDHLTALKLAVLWRSVALTLFCVLGLTSKN
jgi:hypothetical protein